nr:caspase family protein [Maricaulis sp.]
MKKALIVGIDHYNNISPLYGCVNDAHQVKGILERHADGSVNFGVNLLAGTDGLDRTELREAVKQLFAGDCETALFYFAGHGYVESTGGYLCPSDCASGDDGLALSEIMTLANKSNARNRIILLDSCHSGVAGQSALSPISELSEGVTILTASTAEQYASEVNGAGVFTDLLVDGLAGAAANLVGDVTPGAVYAHIDQSLGPWAQRPVFKTNVKSFVSLRKANPVLPLEELRRIGEFFSLSRLSICAGSSL